MTMDYGNQMRSLRSRKRWNLLVELKKQQQAVAQALVELNKQQQALVQAEAENKRLKEELHRQKVSLDSVFNDLEESKATIIKLRNERLENQFGLQSEQLMKEGGQAELIAPVVGKAAYQSGGGFFSSLASDRSSAMQRKIYSLERDNLELKLELVRLQAQYREETYLNHKAMEAALAEDHTTVATVRMDGSVYSSSYLHDSDSSISSGELSPENGDKSLSWSDVLQRIKEYKDRKASLTRGEGIAGVQTGDAATVRQALRIGSLRSSLPRGSLMTDSGDDRPTALRGSGLSSPPHRIQSLWSVAISAGASVQQTETAPAPSHVPRRIQSFQPAHADKPQVNLHDLAEQEPSRPPLFGRSQSTVRRMGWWGK